MKKLSIISAYILAIPLIVFGFNYFIDVIPQPPDDGSIGLDMLELMRKGGMMTYVALGHIIIGIMLIVRKTRFLAAVLQLPISLAIVFFHISLQPGGLVVGCILLLFNLLALMDKEKMDTILS